MTQVLQAPEPLLPNFGAGSSRPFMQDVEMMILLNAGEHTLDELKALEYVVLLRRSSLVTVIQRQSDLVQDSSL